MKCKLRDKFGYHIIGIKILKLFHKTDSSMIPLGLILSVLEAIYPYVGLFLSTMIIDNLLQKAFTKAMVHTTQLLISNLLLGLLIDLLEHIVNHKVRKGVLGIRVMIRDKALILDYETMEKASVIEKVTTTENIMRYRGGMGAIIDQYRSLFSNLLSVTIAIGMVCILCFSKPTQASTIYILANPILSLLLFAFILVVTVWYNSKILKNYSDKMNDMDKEQLSAEHQISYVINQVFLDYSKGKVIRLYSMKNMLMDFYGKWGAIIRKVYYSMCIMDEKSTTIESILNGVASLFSYFLVLIKILTGAISIGAFTKYVGALANFSQGINKLVRENDNIRRTCGYLGNYIDFMELESNRETGTIPIEKRLDNVYEIEFHDVSFSYPGSTEKILNHVSCKLTRKDKMAVVGHNGAGKTTFIKLLCRLYDPTEGFITLNGIDIKKYNYDEYLSLFGVVFQDFNLFAFPIKENIAVSKEVDENKLWECLEQAGIKQRVLEMEKGLDTILFRYDDEGVEVSGGEAQKLAIARALYKDAPFVILDEPTAALDPISEYEIYRRFDEMVKDKTSIYISHRMSSCRFCDNILVFENGTIAERGSHDNLILNNGTYKTLWDAQAQYYA